MIHKFDYLFNDDVYISNSFKNGMNFRSKKEYKIKKTNTVEDAWKSVGKYLNNYCIKNRKDCR